MPCRHHAGPAFVTVISIPELTFKRGLSGPFSLAVIQRSPGARALHKIKDHLYETSCCDRVLSKAAPEGAAENGNRVQSRCCTVINWHVNKKFRKSLGRQGRGYPHL